MRVQPVFPGAAPPAGSVTANRADAATFARLVDRSPTVTVSGGSAVAIAASGGLLAVQRTLGRPSASTSALRRADRLLDGLARGQRALLSPADEAAAWQDLERALAEEREPSGAAALDALLDAVELRVAIELAKRERAAEVRREIPSAASPARRALA